jgi:hypothetical protein
MKGKIVSIPTTLSLRGQEALEQSPQSAEDFIRRIAQALQAGEFVLARRLASEGGARYPQHAELGKYARVLAPPRVLQHHTPSTMSVRANKTWLQEHKTQYRGKWVALRSGELVGVAPSLDALLTQVGSTAGLLLTKV